MSIMAATLIGALAILAGSLMRDSSDRLGAAPFWKHQERQKTRLTIADKIAQFYADLLFNWNLEHSSAEVDRKKEAAWRRESDMQLLAALSTQLASVFSPQALDDHNSLDAALRTLSEMPAEEPDKSGSVQTNRRSLRGGS
jgi:hypothetical protein